MATLTTVNASSTWNVATDFTPEGVPGTGDVVVIASGHSLTIPAGYTTNRIQRLTDAANCVFIMAAGSTLLMQGGATLDGSGTLVTLNGNFTISSDASDMTSSSGVFSTNGLCVTAGTSTSLRGKIENTGAGVCKQLTGYGPYLLDWVEFTGNGYITIYGNNTRANMFSNCRFYDMQSDWYGYFYTGDYIKCINCLFEGNTAYYYFRSVMGLELVNCAFNYNEAGTVDGSAAKIIRDGRTLARNVKISGGDYSNYSSTLGLAEVQCMTGCGYVSSVGLLTNIPGTLVDGEYFKSYYGSLALADDSGTDAITITPTSYVDGDLHAFIPERTFVGLRLPVPVASGATISLTVNARKTAGQPAGSFKVYIDYRNLNGMQDATAAIDSATYADYTASATAPAGTNVHEVSIMPVITDYGSGGICYIASMVAVVGSITYTLDLASMAWVVTGAAGGAAENHFRSSHFLGVN